MGIAEVTTGVVTPSLLVGGLADYPKLDDLVICETPNDAYTVIKSGLTAVLPAGAWDDAAETLRLIGADEKVIVDRIHFAKTGQVLFDV